MKVCPECKTQYTDDSLSFCLQDGTRLSEPQTDHPTVSLGHGETQVKSNAGDSEETRWRPSEVTRVDALGPERRTSGVPWAIAAAAIVVLLFGAAGLGAFLIYKAISGPTSNLANNSNIGTLSGTVSPTPSPFVAKPTPILSNVATPVPGFPTPTPTVNDTELVRRSVVTRINTWKSATEALDIGSLMTNYASTVDYYRRSGVPVSVVRADKQRAFARFNSIRITISNMNVSVDTSGDMATAVFDKEWLFQGSRVTSGKVQGQFMFRKIGGEWLITGERDLKVYYLNR
jgi:hypothetical protein